MTDIKLDRTFWPVGHGAFYSEEFEDPAQKTRFCAIYDCGGRDKATIENNLSDFLEENKKVDFLFVSHLHEDHINGLPYLLKKGNVRHTFLPYLTQAELAETYIYNAIYGERENGVANVESEVQQLVYDIATGDTSTYDTHFVYVTPNLEEQANDGKEYHPSGTPISMPLGKDDFWIYIPVQVKYDVTKCEELIDEIDKSLFNGIIGTDGKIDWTMLIEKLFSINKKQLASLKQIYNETFKGKHNAYSMPVYSGQKEGVRLIVDDCSIFYDVDRFWLHRFGYPRLWHHSELFRRATSRRILPCLYMGDFEAKGEDKLKELKQFLGSYYYMVGMQQVPHHFSRYNHNVDLYEKRFWAFGSVDDGGDISFSQSVYWDIENLTEQPIVVTENESTKFEVNYYLHLY